MTELRSHFDAAARGARSLSREPDTAQLLELYALYKQATIGDVSGPRPGVFDLRARAKHDAWDKAKGLATEEAMTRYIALVARLSAG